MRHPIPDYLASLITELGAVNPGETAPYIPVLAEADPDRLGIALATPTGRLHSAGDADVEFTIQSASKPFTYAAALVDRGFAAVDRQVGLNPSGEAFNELSLEVESHRPDNAMINAGALAVHQLLVGPEASRKERLDRAVEIMSLLAGRRLSVDRETYESEMAVSDRNLSLGHMLRSYGVLQDSAEEIVAGYVAQCAVLVTAKDLAVMGACLATGGIHPMTGERVLPSIVARRVVSVMTSSGMYDAAGQWLADVGIPAKSGVAGGVLGALPGRVGIGVFSPRLDEVGNSARGVLACRRLSEDFRLHLMDGDSLGGTAVRFVEREGDRVFLHLQGVIRFGGAEAVLDALTDLHTGAEKPGTGWDAAVYPRWQEAAADSAALSAATGGGAVYEAAAVAARDENDGPIRTVVLNLARVDRIEDVGRRLIAEGVRRLQADGVRVEAEDPERILPLEEPAVH
ncbi:glutaminase A [Micrococcus luteus]|uniref:glutaminase A n=1 Tax=Micrococcus luteus TaxID=1270 RepID=UPI003517719A